MSSPLRHTGDSGTTGSRPCSGEGTRRASTTGRPFRHGESSLMRTCRTPRRFKLVIAEPTSSSRRRDRVPSAEAGSASWASNRIPTSSSTTSPLSSTRSAGSSARMGRFGSTSATRTIPTAPCGDPPVRSSPVSGILPLPGAEEGTAALRAGTGTSSRRTSPGSPGGLPSNCVGGDGGSVRTASGQSATRLLRRTHFPVRRLLHECASLVSHTIRHRCPLSRRTSAPGIIHLAHG